jgi:hypothetical protein
MRCWSVVGIFCQTFFVYSDYMNFFSIHISLHIYRTYARKAWPGCQLVLKGSSECCSLTCVQKAPGLILSYRSSALNSQLVWKAQVSAFWAALWLVSRRPWVWYLARLSLWTQLVWKALWAAPWLVSRRPWVHWLGCHFELNWSVGSSECFMSCSMTCVQKAPGLILG